MLLYLHGGDILPLSLLALILCGAALIVAAVEDWRSSTVSGLVCLICWVITGLAALLWGLAPVQTFICGVLCAVFYVYGPNCPLGSADILPLAMYIATYVQGDVESPVQIMYPLCVASILIPYAKLYGRVTGTGWKLFNMQYMPMLPCLTAAWWMAVIVYVVYRVA